jgi:small-conductance mechanosensitive channel
VDVQPLDEDGVLAVTLGTVAWLVAFAVLYLFFRDTLQAHGTQWWLTVCLVAAGLGVAGRWYTVRRRGAYQRVRASHD